MNNNYLDKRVVKNHEKNLKAETIEGEGSVLVDEENDKIHFLNATGLILYEEIGSDTVGEVYERYKARVMDTYVINDDESVRESFEGFIQLLLDNELVVLTD